MACGADERTGHRSPLITDCPACLPMAVRPCVSVGVCVNERAACLLGRVGFELVIGPPFRDMVPTPSQWNVSSNVIGGRWIRSVATLKPPGSVVIASSCVAYACAFSSTVSLSIPHVPDGRGFTCANVSGGALMMIGRGDVPPHGEGFEAGQELRPREEARCRRKGRQGEIS